MFFQFNFFGLILVLESLLALGFIFYSYNKREEKVYYYFAFLSFFCFINFLFQGLECLTVYFPLKFFFNQACALGYIFIPPVWLFLVYCLVSKGEDLPVKFKILLLIVPVFSFIQALTNPWTHTYLLNVIPPSSSVMYKLQLEIIPNWGFMLQVFYEWFIVLVNLSLIIYALIKGSKVYQRTYAILLIASCIVFSISILSFTNLFKGFSFQVFAYLITYLFLIVGIFVYDAFDIIKIFSKDFISEVNVGILFFNNDDELVSVNSAGSFIGVVKDDEGKKVSSIFKDSSILLSFYYNGLDSLDYQVKPYWYQIVKKPMILENEVYGTILTITDITSNIMELNQKEILLKEVNYRVKNNLQIILSLLDLDLKYHPKDPMSVLNDTRSRLSYMATLHEELYKSSNTSYVSIKEYLPDIANVLIRMYNSNIKIQYDIEDVIIDLDLAIGLGLILTEIINNTIKYAYPNNEEGNFFIKFNKNNNIGVLDLFDEGEGLPEGFSFDSSKGLGMMVIKRLSAQIDGEAFIIPDSGAHFRIKFPLN
jgi:two-component sensor histidine kinase